MTKQMIVMRKDLNMRKGKMVAQGAHTSVAVLLRLGQLSVKTLNSEGNPLDPIGTRTYHLDISEGPLMDWIAGLFTKICVSVDSEAELLEVYNKALESGLLCALITDCGLTEFNGVPTVTCCAIGPASDEQLQPITGHLKLL